VIRSQRTVREQKWNAIIDQKPSKSRVQQKVCHLSAPVSSKNQVWADKPLATCIAEVPPFPRQIQHPRIGANCGHAVHKKYADDKEHDGKPDIKCRVALSLRETVVDAEA
jgi:hypothetical protein